MKNKIKIGLIGFGVVGEGVYQVIQNTPSLHATIKKIAIKHPLKKRNAPEELFTTDVDEIIFDDTIDVVVELIDDAETAYTIVKTALQQKKHVVSANKKMIAHHLPELIELQQENKVSFLYEAAVCGSIPIIRNLEEYFDNDLLFAISGIVNGSTNFILTQIKEKGLSYDDGLKLAQELGFAESNPALDVEGIDAVNKLTILLKHTFGIDTSPDKIFHKGINSIANIDTQYAAEKGYQIKLIAHAICVDDDKVVSYVIPSFIKNEHQLAQVKNEYNGVLLSSKLADEQFFYGKGAGRYPTSSAVLSDLSALRYGYRYEYKKSKNGIHYHLTNDYSLLIFVSFKDELEIDISDFERITQKFVSEDRCYVTGIIKLQTLHNAKWIHNESVSVLQIVEDTLALTDKEFAAQQRHVYELIEEFQ